MILEPAFKIDRLKCSYPGSDGKIVLDIPSLEIPFGKLIVFLGASGVGKSTLLETLGLMNHTIEEGLVKFQGELKDFATLWQQNVEYIPEVRSKYMSFVFQENNLLDNLGALDNLLISHLIQGRSEKESMEAIKPWLEYLNMEFVLENPSARHLSVGQKQRLSFIRAASVDFSVLFGDEPTGNLDEVNGEILMARLRAQIKEKEKNRLAIIVSHNIDLTLKSADLIFVLKQKDKKSPGTISMDHVFKSSAKRLVRSELNGQPYYLTDTADDKYVECLEWHHHGDGQIIDPRQEIVELLKTK